MRYTIKMEIEVLKEGSIINVHRHDGSSTGGYQYGGINVFAGADKREPELSLEPIDEGQTAYNIPISEVAWIDTLATPFNIDDRR